MTGFQDARCDECRSGLTLEAMHADGAAYSCSCGRVRLTILGGVEQLDLGSTPLGIVTDEQLRRYAAGEAGDVR